MKTWIELIIKRLDSPTDTASAVLLRIVVGLLMFWEMTRYYYNGWIRELYVKPQLYFQYEWFQWLRPLPEEAMYLLFASLAILSLMIALGFFYRISTLLFFFGIQLFFSRRTCHLQQSLLSDLPAEFNANIGSTPQVMVS